MHRSTQPYYRKKDINRGIYRGHPQIAGLTWEYNHLSVTAYA